MEIDYPVLDPSKNTKGTSAIVHVNNYVDYEALAIQPPASYYSLHVEYTLPIGNFDYQPGLVYKNETALLLDAKDFHMNYEEDNTQYGVRFRNTRFTLLYNESVFPCLIDDFYSGSVNIRAELLKNMKPFNNLFVTLVAVPPDVYDVSIFRDLVIQSKAQIITSFPVHIDHPESIKIDNFVLFPQWKLYAVCEYYCHGNYAEIIRSMFNNAEKAKFSLDFYINTSAEILHHSDKEEEDSEIN